MKGWGPAVVAVLLSACGGGTVGALDAEASMDAGVPGPPDAAPVRLPDAAHHLPDAASPPDASVGHPAPYPIVLVHGFFGFEDFAGVDYVTYFFHVREDLAARGETDVFTPALDPFQDSETRGRELLGHIEGILEETGAARVNLIGHSQGGLDARVAASLRPDLVASVTTYATPNRSGAPVADVVLGLVDDRRFEALADALVRLIAAPLWDAAGNETSVFASLHQLSTPGIEALNAAHPDAEDVTYFSIAGRTDRDDGGTVCQAPGAPGFITRYARSLDPVDPLLDLAEQITDGGADDLTNDGLVRVDSAKWGRFLGCVPADHFDEVGQLLGDGPGFGNDFDHYELFAGLVAFLRERGF